MVEGWNVTPHEWKIDGGDAILLAMTVTGCEVCREAKSVKVRFTATPARSRRTAIYHLAGAGNGGRPARPLRPHRIAKRRGQYGVTDAQQPAGRRTSDCRWRRAGAKRDITVVAVPSLLCGAPRLACPAVPSALLDNSCVAVAVTSPPLGQQYNCCPNNQQRRQRLKVSAVFLA